MNNKQESKNTRKMFFFQFTEDFSSLQGKFQKPIMTCKGYSREFY